MPPTIRKTVSPFAGYERATATFTPRLIMCLQGEVGCLAGDTPVVVRRQERHTRPMTLQALYEKFTRQSARQWDPAYPTFLQSLTDTEQLFYNPIEAVIAVGVKPLVQVTFSDGSVLRATSDHPVLTSNGFVSAGDLTLASAVVGRGSCLAVSQGKTAASPKRQFVYVRFHPYGHSRHVTPVNARTKTIRTYTYKEVSRARLVVEAELNGLAYEAFVQILKSDQPRAEQCAFLSPEFEVHHRNEQTLDDRLENLEVMTTADHARHHSARLNTLKDYLRTKQVLAVQNAPAAMTYDVQMAEPARNFCAGNTVVHNCGKTDFALGAPGPIVVHTFDQGTEGVVEEHVARGKEIYLAKYDLGVEPGQEVTHAAVVELRDQFIANFEADIARARTVIIDRESDLWNFHVFAETGTDDKFAAAAAKDWPKIKAKIRRLVAMAKASKINLILTQGMRNEWGRVVNPKTGNMTSTPTGNRIPDGMEEIVADVHIVADMKRVDHEDGPSQFFLHVGKSRGPGSKMVQGQTFEVIKASDDEDAPQPFGFKEFAQLVFPDTTEENWS